MRLLCFLPKIDPIKGEQYIILERVALQNMFFTIFTVLFRSPSRPLFMRSCSPPTFFKGVPCERYPKQRVDSLTPFQRLLSSSGPIPNLRVNPRDQHNPKPSPLPIHCVESASNGSSQPSRRRHPCRSKQRSEPLRNDWQTIPIEQLGSRKSKSCLG